MALKIKKITDKVLFDVKGQIGCDPDNCLADCCYKGWTGNKQAQTCEEIEYGNGHWSDSY